MKNKRGMTLVELIISMALISLIVVFLFRLLVDVKYVDNNRDYISSNAQKRAIILSRVQTDFIERKLIGLKEKESGDSKLIITFTYLDGTTAELTFAQDKGGYYVNYQNQDSEEKWYIETGNKSPKINFNCVKYSLTTDENDRYFSIRFIVPIEAKKGSPNAIDDFEFSYVGLKINVNLNDFPNSQSLGNYDANTCS